MPDKVDTALQAAAEAAAHAAQEVLDAYHIKMGGVLVVAELPKRETADPCEKIVETASWLFVSNESSLPVIADTLRGVVVRLYNQQEPAPANTTSN